MAKKMMSGSGIIHNASKGTPPNTDRGTSAPQNTAVGSGSRPTRSKMAIDTSSPMDCHTQGRDVPGSLK